MPWTQINYPSSMKKLPLVVRKKAIEIANALLKKDKKMKEGEVIATAIKNAKTFIAKKTKSVKAAPKKKVAKKKVAPKKVAAKSKRKASPKKKVAAKKAVKATSKRKVAAKKVAKPTKKKAKAKVASKSPVKVVAKKKVKRSEKKIAEPVQVSQASTPFVTEKKKAAAKRKRTEPKKVDVDAFIIEPLIPIEEAKGEDQNFIPDAFDVKPINTFQIHNFENVFHHREEVALHQENAKVKAAKSSRKNDKRTYRMKGNR